MAVSRSFRYTLPTGTLSEYQREFYELNGYVIVQNLVEKQILEDCRQRFIDICNGKVWTTAIILKEHSLIKTVPYGEALINKIQDISNDEVFQKYLENDKLLDAVSSITGPRIESFHSMVINKPPKSGRHPVHQDYYYNPYKNPDRMVTAWTAIDDVNVDNGCLFIFPGSHNKEKIVAHGMPEDKVNVGFASVNENELRVNNGEPINLIIKSGDTVFIHPCVLHGSRPNTTDSYRKVISGLYKSMSCGFRDVESNGLTEYTKMYNDYTAKKGVAPISSKEYGNLKKKVVRDVKTHI